MLKQNEVYLDLPKEPVEGIILAVFSGDSLTIHMPRFLIGPG